MKVSQVSKAVLLALLAASAARAEEGGQSVFLHIDAQPVRTALQQFGKQTGLDVLVRLQDGTLDDLQTSPVDGNFTASAALDRLLSHTGLKYEFVNARTVSVRLPVRGASSGESSAAGFQVAQTDGAGTTGASSEDHSTSSDTLAEIIVTAQKRTEKLLDVPVPVSVTNPEDLIQNNQTKLLDYYSKVPGLTLTPVGFGNSMVSIRGITTGANAFENPTVSFVVDDIPYGSSTSAGGGVIVPDINPSDLARIEVLRGPQGTLYGASSLGGTIKYVTVDPDPTHLSGRIQTGLSSIKNGDGLGNNLRASVNVPINDRSAIRASAYYQLEPGYIDNPVNKERGVNRAASYGGRLAGLWNITDDVTAKLSATVQHVQADGSNDLDPALGDLQQNYLRGTNTMTRDYQVYSATVDARLGAATLKSITAYSINKEKSSVDLSIYGFFQQLAADNFNGVRGAPLTNIFDSKKFSQELRLELPLTSNIDWLVGAFYTHEQTPYLQQDLAANEVTGQVVGEGGHFLLNSSYRSFAAFTDLTFHLTDRFDVQVGGRESFNHQSAYEVDDGVYIPIFTGGLSEHDDYGGPVKSKDNAFTYLFTPRFKFSDDFMVYARVASGFRSGGTNGSIPVSFQVSRGYSPDKTQNYEVGFKANALDGKLFVDMSLYDIEWKDIQVTANLGVVQPFINGGKARSRGAELSVSYKPVQSTTLSGWVDFSDAKLTSDFPTTVVAGSKGDRLPYSPRLSGFLSAENEFSLTSDVQGFVGASVNYLGDRKANFTGAGGERTNLPSYARVDLHFGARFDDWTTNFFVNNLVDRRGLVDKGFGYYDVIQPRTLGVNLSKVF